MSREKRLALAEMSDRFTIETGIIIGALDEPKVYEFVRREKIKAQIAVLEEFKSEVNGPSLCLLLAEKIDALRKELANE